MTMHALLIVMFWLRAVAKKVQGVWFLTQHLG